MALPEYFARNALAAAQAISGLDEQRLAAALDDTVIGISVGQSLETDEGLAAADMLVRLLARLYPRIALRSSRRSARLTQLHELATRINPLVELSGDPTIEVILGDQRLSRSKARRIYVGSNGWQAEISADRVLTCGSTNIPFGAGLAACLAAANVFRLAFLPDPKQDGDSKFSALPSGELRGSEHELSGALGDVVLVGAGAIGNGAAWALSRVSMSGRLRIVDHESVDLGNLQRYVLAERKDEGAVKAQLLSKYFQGPLEADGIPLDLAEFLDREGHAHEAMLLALDSAKDRRAAQASLPRWVANAWTQPGDLGLSTHDFLNGACVSCLYLPAKALRNEDEIIAEAFGVPEQLMVVRGLLHSGAGTPAALLDAVAAARGIDLAKLLAFEGRPLRALYIEGFCGGAVIPLGQVGTPRAEVHVPLAHQSAMAGVLLGAAAVRKSLGGARSSVVTQVDVLSPVPLMPSRPAAKEPSGRCICHDSDYRRAYENKYATSLDGVVRRARSAKTTK